MRFARFKFRMSTPYLSSRAPLSSLLSPLSSRVPSPPLPSSPLSSVELGARLVSGLECRVLLSSSSLVSSSSPLPSPLECRAPSPSPLSRVELRVRVPSRVSSSEASWELVGYQILRFFSTLESHSQNILKSSADVDTRTRLTRGEKGAESPSLTLGTRGEERREDSPRSSRPDTSRTRSSRPDTSRTRSSRPDTSRTRSSTLEGRGEEELGTKRRTLSTLGVSRLLSRVLNVYPRMRSDHTSRRSTRE